MAKCNANRHRTMDKYDIPTKSIHSDVEIFILCACSKFHGPVFNCCLVGRIAWLDVPSLTTIAVNFVCARIYCTLFIT